MNAQAAHLTQPIETSSETRARHSLKGRLGIAFTLIVWLAGCGVPMATPPAAPTPGPIVQPSSPPPSASMGGFPFPVGTTWVYSRVEYEQAIGEPTKIITATRVYTDSVTQIQGTAPSQSFAVERTVNETSAPEGWWSSTVLNPGQYGYRIRGSQILETRSSNPQEEVLLYNFPLEANKRWCLQPLQPANASGCNEIGWREVKNKGSVAVPVGTFEDCYQILDPYYTGGTEWFCTGIGVTSRKYDHSGTRFGYEDKLIRYARGSSQP